MAANEDATHLAWKIYDEIEEHRRLVSSGELTPSMTLEDLEMYKKFNAYNSHDETKRFEDEALTLECAILWKKAIFNGMQINTGQDMKYVYSNFAHLLFANYKSSTHVCMPMRCNTFSYDKGKPILHPFTKNPLPNATGVVYVCETTACVHICTETTCDRIVVMARGENACPISCRPFSPDSILSYKEMKDRGITIKKDHSSDEDEDGEIVISPEDTHVSYETSFLPVRSVRQRTRNHPVELEVSKTMERKIIVENNNKKKAVLKAKSDARLEEKIKNNKASINNSMRDAFAVQTCKTIMHTFSFRKEAIEKVKLKEAAALAALKRVVESDPTKIWLAYATHANLFVKLIPTFHPSVWYPEFTTTEIHQFSRLVLAIWDMIKDSPWAKLHPRTITPENLFAPILYMVQTGYSPDVIVEKNTGTLLHSIRKHEMNAITMYVYIAPIVEKHNRLNALIDKTQLGNKKTCYSNINIGLSDIIRCFNSQIALFTNISQLAIYNLKTFSIKK